MTVQVKKLQWCSTKIGKLAYDEVSEKNVGTFR